MTDPNYLTNVYLAGPYTEGDVAQNVRDVLRLADYLADKPNIVPFVPHLTHFWHLVFPQPNEYWLAYDLIWLGKCDALIRLEGESSGADREVFFAIEHGLPFFEFAGFNADGLNALDKWLEDMK